MASGDRVVEILTVNPLAVDFATPGIRSSGTNPAEKVSVWKFDAAVLEYLDFSCALNGYGGNGLTFTIFWTAATAISGATRWEIGIRRMDDGGSDIDVSHTYIYQSVDATATGTSGTVDYATLTLTNAQIDGWLDTELAIVRLRRNGSHANDNMANDAELWGLVGKET